MVTKTVLTPISSSASYSTAVAAININMARIEEAINDSLSRSGRTPNTWEATVDANSNRLINLPEAVSDLEPIRFGDAEDRYAPIAHTHSGLVPTGGTTGQALVKTGNGDYAMGWADIGSGGGGGPANTDALPEGSTNLYYTNARADARIAAAVGVSIQAYDADLAALAALATTSFGRTLLTETNASSLRTTLGLSNLATTTGSAFAITLLDDADAATARSTLGLGTLATQSGTFSGTSSGTNTGDQNIFSTVAVSGQSNVVADTSSDTLTLVAGTNVTITTDASTDSITINASGGSSSNSFATIAVSGQSDVVADSSTDTLTVVAGEGITITTNAGTDTLTVANTKPRRELLTAGRVYYVRTDGSDSNDGLDNTSGRAFLTIQKAINTVAGLDADGQTVTITIADGTYVENLSLYDPVGTNASVVNIVGASEAGVIIAPSSGVAILASGSVRYNFSTLTVTGGTHGFHSDNRSLIRIGGAVTHAGSTTAKLYCTNGGVIRVTSGTQTFTAGGSYCIWTTGIASTLIATSRTFSFPSAITFSTNFIRAQAMSGCQVSSMTFTNIANVTGNRYYADLNSIIQTATGSATYLPGTVNGSTDGFAVYN